MNRAGASAADLQLLRAATLAETEAESAWNDWQALHSIDSAGPGSQPLFGMVYANLGSDRAGPQAARLKGIYKRNRYVNQMAFAQVRPLLERLAGQGAEALLLNDAALLAAYYPDNGWRALRCVDLLLRQEQRAVGAEAARAEGWEARPERSFGVAGQLSADLYVAPERRSLRIWTNLFGAEPREQTESGIFRGARTVTGAGTEDQRWEMAATGPVESLLSVSADALRGREVPLHAYADALRLLRHIDAEEDWARLVWQAQRYEHVLPLRRLLSVADRVAPGTLPGWVLPSLRRMAIAYSELLQFHRACDTRGLRLKSAGLRWYRRLRPGGRNG